MLVTLLHRETVLETAAGLALSEGTSSGPWWVEETSCLLVLGVTSCDPLVFEETAYYFLSSVSSSFDLFVIEATSSGPWPWWRTSIGLWPLVET